MTRLAKFGQYCV